MAEMTLQEKRGGGEGGGGEVGKRPNVGSVVEAMGAGFRELLGRLGCNW